jgi:tetratricopeptide (TPR) repeat protein
MKNLYRILSKVLIVLLMAIIPMVSFTQTEKKGAQPVKKEAQPVKKEAQPIKNDNSATKKEEPKKVRNTAPTNTYWSVTAYGALNQFNGDLAKNVAFNEKWTFGAGGMFTRQFGRVIGVRLRGGWVPLRSGVTDQYLPKVSNRPDGLVTQDFKSWVIEAAAEGTVNWVNWFWGSKPERFFSSYLILGVGADHTQGVKYNEDGVIINYLGYPGHLTSNADQGSGGVGNNSGIGKWNLEFTAHYGIGFDFNINKHWSINPEFQLRWRDGDVLDLTKGGAKSVYNDMYSGANLGVTYKFAYGGCSIKSMEKNYGLVKYETNPTVLSKKGDSVTVTIKGTFPEKYFCPKAAMYFEPVVKYEGGSYALKPMQFMGEKVTGDGTMIKYKEGGSFTYTTSFPYKPEMAVSELVVAPIIYEAKEKTIPKKDEIKVNAKFGELPSRDLAPGIISTDLRIALDMTPTLAEHGYQKEVIVSKTGVIYFKINLYNLDLKYGLNKTKPVQDNLAEVTNFVKQGWKIKDISLNGWASPDGEETFNAGLSQNRAKTSNTYMIDQFKGWVKDAQKDNKDKKAVKTMVEAAGKDVNFVVQSHGPDWNGFLTTVKNSDLKDKDKILNVINSAGDSKKKEMEIRNMIVIYPELETKLLPPLRRAEITANLYEPRKTDAEISQLAVSNPDQLKVEELLYAGTLAPNDETKLTIYDNAARLFPTNWKALNNAANANIVKGDLDKASNYLSKAATSAPNNGIVENNIGVVAAKQKDYKKAEAQFKKAQQLGENENYNLGVLMIPKGNYTQAASSLANAKCTYNLGLAQLLSGNSAAAQTTLQCAPQNPENAYLQAIIGARTNNTKMLYDNLMKAVADPKLKEQARTDREFYNYANSQDFKNIVK